MICSVNKHNIENFIEFSDKDNVFACDIHSSLKAFGKSCSWVFGGIDEKTDEPFCLIKAVTTGYILYAENLEGEKLSSVCEFFEFVPKRDIIGSKDNIQKLAERLGGSYVEKLIMKKSYDGFQKQGFEDEEKPIHPLKFIDMFNVLNKRFKNDCPKALKNDWIYTTSLKERKAGSVALCIYEGEKCVSCGFLDSVNSKSSIIASLATLKEFEGKGYGTKIVKNILSLEQMKDKTAYVVLMDSNLKDFYKRLDFENSGTYCILSY